MSRLASWPGCLAITLCCAALASCSDVERLELSDATLEGKITYEGKPVPYALVIVTNGKMSSTANAASDGSYKVEHVPIGEVQIGVNTKAGRGMMRGAVMSAQQGGKGEKLAEFVSIPQKYFKPSTSGITTTIKDGANHFDITIE